MPLHASEAASAPTKCSSPLTGGWEAFRAGSVVGFLIHACVVRAAERKETAALLCPLSVLAEMVSCSYARVKEISSPLSALCPVEAELQLQAGAEFLRKKSWEMSID